MKKRSMQSFLGIPGLALACALVAVTGCSKAAKPGTAAGSSSHPEPVTAASAESRADHLEIALLATLESLAEDAEEGESLNVRAARETKDYPDLTGHERPDRLRLGATRMAAPRHAVFDSIGRSLTFRVVGGWFPGRLENPYTENLEQQIAELRNLKQAMEQMPREERDAAQEVWEKTEPRLQKLARDIVQTSSESADLYAPVLFELLSEVGSLSSAPPE